MSSSRSRSRTDPLHEPFSEGEVRFFDETMMPLPDSINPGKSHNEQEIDDWTDAAPG